MAVTDEAGAPQPSPLELLDAARFSPLVDETFDVVFDAANALDWRRAQPLLVRGGLYLGTGGTLQSAAGTAAGSLLAPLLRGTRARNVTLRANAAAWARLAKLAAQGVLKPHVERRIGLAEVAAAQAAMATGHGRGKTVVVPAQ